MFVKNWRTLEYITLADVRKEIAYCLERKNAERFLCDGHPETLSVSITALFYRKKQSLSVKFHSTPDQEQSFYFDYGTRPEEYMETLEYAFQRARVLGALRRQQYKQRDWVFTRQMEDAFKAAKRDMAQREKEAAKRVLVAHRIKASTCRIGCANSAKKFEALGFTPPKAGPSRVYLLQAHRDKGMEYKIGRSADVARRYFDLQFACPEPLTYIGSVPETDIINEKTLHAAFKSARLHGEWFQATPALDNLAEDFRKGALAPERMLHG